MGKPDMDELVNVNLSTEDLELYFIAKAATENSKGRKIVTWIRSDRFERILKQYFNLSVLFGISQRKETIKEDYINDFNVIKGNSANYYLVSLDRNYDDGIYELLKEFGYSEVKDYIFRKHKPIVLQQSDFTGSTYSDIYGNSIESSDNIKINKVIFRGCNNHIYLGKNIGGLTNITVDFAANTTLRIGDNSKFTGRFPFECYGFNGKALINIGRNCRFTNGLIRLYTHSNLSSVVINDDCTFETNFEAHANGGKKLILGKDCMISHNVYLWAGDGHAIFDLESKKLLNYDQNSNKKDTLVLGNHVWVGYGAFIMHGTNIGDGCVVGAKSVVKGTYPNNCSLAGNPSKIVRKNISWARDMYAKDIGACNGYTQHTTEAKAAISGCNVLVIGGTRFMGVQLVYELLAHGNIVTIATRGTHADRFGDRVNRIVLDVSNVESVAKALNGKYYDYIFDNLAYCSINANNVLSNVKCGRYIQLSSVETYMPTKMNLVEEDFDPYNLTFELCSTNVGYQKGKRQAEALVYQKYKDVSAVTVRVPYVTKTERLYYYCKCIQNEISMNIEDINHGFTFIRDTEVGKFLPWIAAQEYNGPINLASEGQVTIAQILNYIEAKLGKKAIIDTENGEESPFHMFKENSFTMNMNKAKSLGYKTSQINDWFWQLMDEYIARAVKESYLNEIGKVEAHSAKEKIILFQNKNIWEFAAKTMLALDGNLCTGCLACMNACPKNAINVTEDQYGFIVPGIDTDKCIKCGTCKDTCPKLNLVFKNEKQDSCYALMANNEVRHKSASGGAFTVFANYILKQSGVVCGAGWTQDYGLEHIIIDNKEELKKIQGSKYLQSTVNFTYRNIKYKLETGKKVLFVGTPCQVDGLLHYLKKDYDNLYTVDLFCRGVPSSKMFKRYLNEIYGNEQIKSVTHKSKQPNGWGAYTLIEHESYTESLNMNNDIWMCAFLSDFMFRDSCYSCPYSKQQRVGDLSIGDFWQVAKLDKEFDDRLGTSIVLANTRKGKEFLENSDDSKISQSYPLSFELPFNSALWGARKEPANRELFFDMLTRAPIGAALDRATFGKKYDIGIVGWWENLNYGGTLTYFALNQAISKLGYSVMMIRKPKDDSKWTNDNTVPVNFAKKHYTISRTYTRRDMHLLNYACKGFVSGSDQLWNPWLEVYAGKECFLSFANKNCIRVSYASSFGNIDSVPDPFVLKYKPDLDKFDAISVREDYAVDLCKKYFGVQATHVCDPVFLNDESLYAGIAEDSDVVYPDKFSMNFLLDPTEKKVGVVREIAKRYNFEYVNFTDLQNTAEKVKAFMLDNVYANHSIEDFVKAYRDCQFVVTDSFHGTCFAIIFNKPFICIGNKGRGIKRFESLLRWLGLEDRLVYDEEDVFNNPKYLEPINYDTVNRIVDETREKSLQWLKEALAKRHKEL